MLLVNLYIGPKLFRNKCKFYAHVSLTNLFFFWTFARVQPWWIQGIRRGDGIGDQETTAYLNVN